MKILYYSKEFGAPTTTFIRNEVEWFKQHHECKYLCEKAVYSPDDVSVTSIPFEENPVIRKIRWTLWKLDWVCNFYNPAFSKNVINYIENYHPDVIHCHFAYEGISLIDNIDADKYRIIVHFHGYDATQMIRKKSYVRKLKKILSRKNVYAISCNDYFVHLLSDVVQIPRSKFFVLRCGINLNLFNPPATPKVKPYKVFLQVSSLAEKKGHEYTLRAFARFLNNAASNHFKLIITGNGARKKMLVNLTRELGIEANVEFVGTVAPENAAELLAASDVFLHHSVTSPSGDMEGIPTAIMEAMAMELPVVSTYHSGIPELVEDGVNGFLVKERDIEDYAKKMAEALNMGRISANRRKIEKYYNKDTHNMLLEAYYKKILTS